MVEPCSYNQFIKTHQHDNEISLKQVDEIIIMLNEELKATFTTPIEKLKQIHCSVVTFSFVNEATHKKVAEIFESVGWKRVEFKTDHQNNKLTGYTFTLPN